MFDLRPGKPPKRFRHVGFLDGDSLQGEPPSLRGQVDRMGAPVALDGAPLDEAGGDEPVHKAGDIALGDIEALGQLLLAQAFPFGECRQHIALGNRKTELLELSPDGGHHAGLQPDEPEPDPVRVLRSCKRHNPPVRVSS